MKKIVHVLAVEGGGCAGEAPARFLSQLPTDQQTLALDCDRLILTGCSVGAILAAAYASGRMFAEVEEKFRTRAKECFTKRWEAKINPLACPTYRNDCIDAVMRDMMGDTKLGDVRNIFNNVDLVIGALDVTNDKPVIFTTLNHEYDDVLLVDIAGFSSCAPTYFDGREFRGNALIDFGIIDVSSAVTAVTVVKDLLGVPFCMQRLLLLGSGDDWDPDVLTPKRYRSLGLVGILKHLLIPYITKSNKISTRSQLAALGLNYFNYFNPIRTTKALDDVSQIPEISEEADKHAEEFKEVWNEWLNG